MHTVEDDTHALPPSVQSSDTDEESQEGEGSPATVGRAQSHDHSENDTGDDTSNAETLGKCLSWCVTVANGPSDEVGMKLVTKSELDCGNDVLEGRWVGRGRECFEQSCSLLAGQVEVSDTTVSDVNRDDAGDFFSEWLNGERLVRTDLLESVGRFLLVVDHAVSKSGRVLAPTHGRWCHAFSSLVAWCSGRCVEWVRCRGIIDSPLRLGVEVGTLQDLRGFRVVYFGVRLLGQPFVACCLGLLRSPDGRESLLSLR